MKSLFLTCYHSLNWNKSTTVNNPNNVQYKGLHKRHRPNVDLEQAMPIKKSDCAVTYKVLIVGDSGVGKSAILNYVTGRAFDEKWRPTVGIDFVTKIIEADGALIELRVWDTAGLESFRSMTRRQFRGVQGVFLVYDVTDPTSFESLSYWLSSIPNATTSRSPQSRFSYEPIPFVVLGNKTDLTERKKVGIMQGLKMANSSMAFGFYETSAKTGKNIFAAFHKLAFTITDINHPKLMKSYHRYQIRPLGTTDNVVKTSLPKRSHSFTYRQNSSSSSSSTTSLRPKSTTATTTRHRSFSLLPFTMLRTKTDKFVKKQNTDANRKSGGKITKSGIETDAAKKQRNKDGKNKAKTKNQKTDSKSYCLRFQPQNFDTSTEIVDVTQEFAKPNNKTNKVSVFFSFSRKTTRKRKTKKLAENSPFSIFSCFGKRR